MESTDWKARSRLLLGDEKLEKLAAASVLVVGLGGVGGYAVEMLARAGVGRLTLVDGDVVEATNRNRQLLALVSTDGQPKAELMARRVLDINPEAQVDARSVFVGPGQAEELLAPGFDYVLDCIDTLQPKARLLEAAFLRGLPTVSAMGAGASWDPEAVQVADFWKTRDCRLATKVRKALKHLRGKHTCKAVFTPEPTKGDLIVTDGQNHKKSSVGTISYMPAVVGCVVASVALRDLMDLR